MRALAAVALLAHPVWAASPLHSAQQEKVLLARLEATENDGSLVEICKDGLTSWEGDVCCPSSCNQCGGDGCLKDEGGSNGCCIDEIHASNEVCSSASDVKCVMPKTCAEDKCLIECPYNRGCEAVWKRRGWNAPQKHDFDEGMISAPEAAPAVARERLQVSRPPDESIVELCKAGLTNWAGDVCCSSSCDQCGGNGASNDCSIDQIHVSSKVCSSASDVSCIMPKTCAEDQCLLECPYEAACVDVWRRRGWTARRRAVVQATYDRMRGALSAAGLAPVGFVNFSQPSARAVHAVEEELLKVEGLASASQVDPKVARWMRLAAAELAAGAGEVDPGAGGSARRDTRNSTRSNSSAGGDGARAAAQVVLQAGQSTGGAAACRVLPVVVHDPAAMTLLQLQLPSVNLGTSPPLTEAAWARRLLAKALSAQVT